MDILQLISSILDSFGASTMTMFHGLANMAFSMKQTIMGGSMATDAINLFNLINTCLDEDTSLFSGLSSTIELIGLGLMLCFWLFHLVDMYTKDQVTLQSFIRGIFELIIANEIITNADVITSFCRDVGVEILEAMGGTDESDTSAEAVSNILNNLKADYEAVDTKDRSTFWSNAIGDSKEVFTSYCEDHVYAICDGDDKDGTNAWVWLLLCIKSLFPWLFSLILSIFMLSMVAGKAITLTVYAIFAPIGLCDLFAGSFMQSSAFRFIKSYLALALEAAIVIAVYMVAAVLSAQSNVFTFASDGASAISGILFPIIIRLAAVSVAGKSDQIARGIIGQ